MDAFASFDNTLGFFIGNEVIALANQSLAAPYVKAAARDLKAYRNSKGYRDIPVGYSAADIAELRPMLQDYLACGTNASESIDMFGIFCLGSMRHGDRRLMEYDRSQCLRMVREQRQLPDLRILDLEHICSGLQHPHLLLRDGLQHCQATYF